MARRIIEVDLTNVARGDMADLRTYLDDLEWSWIEFVISNDNKEKIIIDDSDETGSD